MYRQRVLRAKLLFFYLNLLLFCRSCCRRRRRCLRSLLFHPTEQIVDRACKFLSSCRCPSCFSNNFYNLYIGLPKLQNNQERGSFVSQIKLHLNKRETCPTIFSTSYSYVVIKQKKMFFVVVLMFLFLSIEHFLKVL